MSVSRESLHQELWALLSNADIAMSLSECKSPEECYNVVRAYISDMPMSAFTDSMKFINYQLEQTQDGLLSDDELDNVAGGASFVGVPIILGAAAAAAAAV